MSYASTIARKEQKLTSLITVMEVGNFKARLMRARRLKGESVFGLPPGEAVEVLPIGALPGCPESWVRAAGTYVCPVSTDWGLWFDWTMNDSYNTAIIPSVKGMNPITGQKIEHIGMEQYRDKCPIHSTEFSHERYCKECDYKWPAQNYVCYPDTLWWDGFRAPDGSVRQFFFTEDEKRDIASLVMGKENTVPAFGFVFYSTKNPRNIQPPQTVRMNYGPWGKSLKKYASSGTGYASSAGNAMSSPVITHHVANYSGDDAVFSCEEKTGANMDMLRSRNMEVKDVSVGGGARIDQKLSPDPLALDAWTEKESGLIRLYFVFEEQFKQIVKKGGIIDISGTDEGYLSGLPLG